MDSDVRRPWHVTVTVGLLLLFVAIFVVMNGNIVFLAFSLPLIYVIRGVFLGDNLARWVITILFGLIVGGSVYMAIRYLYFPHDLNDTLTVSSQFQDSVRQSYISQILTLVLCSSPLILLHLPDARRWFARG